jgi:N-acetylglucosamine-6-phosphate deacetylase
MQIEGIDTSSKRALGITIENGIISCLQTIDAYKGIPLLSHGFLDIQVNGYQGIDYSGESICQTQIVSLVEKLMKTGTTRHIPTIITNSQKRMVKNIAIIEQARTADPALAHAIPGIHLEGPYIASADGPRGAHDKAFIRNPSLQELDEWQKVAGDLIKIITLAPELPGAMEFIREASQRGIVIAIGHTAASPAILQEAMQAGARMSTHLGNGSHAQLPRLQNYLWEQLAADSLWASIIADGFHLPKSVLTVIKRAKSLERLILVSDVAFAGGLEKGVYTWGDIGVQVHADGHLGLEGTSFLAGAGHLLDHDIASFSTLTKTPIEQSIILATSNPAALLKLEGSQPGFKVGDPANIVSFSWQEGDTQLGIEQVIFHDRMIRNQTP